MSSLEIRRLLFLGSVQKREACRDNPICSEAANNYQLNLIEALVRRGVEQTLALTLLPVYFLGRALFGRLTGLLAAALLAIMPGKYLRR